ncbi:hypothetical protein RI367_004804 [Sorochytrium milnesiophthora]
MAVTETGGNNSISFAPTPASPAALSAFKTKPAGKGRRCKNASDGLLASSSSSSSAAALVTPRQTNVLLVKNPVGHARPSTYTLPAEPHAYGLPPAMRNATAAQVLHHWHTNEKSKNAEPPLDFTAMNKASAKDGVTQPGPQYEYRKTHPIRKKIADGSKGFRAGALQSDTPAPAKPSWRKLPSDTNASFTYGLPTRPSSPVVRCMTDYYQRQYDEEMLRREAAKEAAIKKKMPQHRHDPTRALQHKPTRHLTIFERDPATLFKMKQFQHAEARVDHIRREDDVQLRRSAGHPVVV